MSKKCLALLLAACLIAPALTGCQRLAEEAPGASEEETAPEAPQAQQPEDENGAGLAEENKTSGEVELEADDKLSAAAESTAEPSEEEPEAEAELTGEQPARWSWRLTTSSRQQRRILPRKNPLRDRRRKRN